MSFTIKGTGSALPRLVVTNDDLSRIVDTSDEWITTRTGVKERRVLSSETLTDLALEAAKKALEDAGVKPGHHEAGRDKPSGKPTRQGRAPRYSSKSNS